MNITFQSWMQAVWNSIINPADMAARVLGFKFSRDAMWSALALVAVLHVLFLAVMQMVFPARIVMNGEVVELTPFAYLAFIGPALGLLVLMLVRIGRMVGGTGTLDSGLMLVVWSQAVSLTLKMMQLCLLLISPPVSSLLSILSFGISIWIFVIFINVLHDFSNLAKSAVVIVLAGTIALFGSGFVLLVLGITPPVGAPT